MKRHVHFVGIGGAGLSAIARVLHERGEVVTGSDLRPSEYARALVGLGVEVSYGHRAENVAGADLVVLSSAIPENNPEWLAATGAGIPVLKRNEFLGEVVAGRKTIAIAGTHGKTTTTALIAYVLDRAGMDPGFILGGWLESLGGNGREGTGDPFVIEADEYDHAFLALRPSIAVVTNVEHDHPDCFPTEEEFRAAFQMFVNQVTDLVVVCIDDPGAASLGTTALDRQTYGLGEDAAWRAVDIQPNEGGGMGFDVLARGVDLGKVSIALPGLHNVRNTLAVVVVADSMGIPFDDVVEYLPSFTGVKRRFQILGEIHGVIVVDDYAHHPTEIKATLSSARMRYPRASLWAVFQPHTYSRTQAFLEGYKSSFSDADHVVVLDVYAAREEPVSGLDGGYIASQMDHPQVQFVPGIEDATTLLLGELKPGSVVITLSAGNGNRVGMDLLERLKRYEGGRLDEEKGPKTV